MSEIRNSSPWFLVTVEISSDAEETASALLFEMGSNGIVTFEERADSVTIGAYFSDSANGDDIKQALEAEFGRAASSDRLRAFSVSPVAEQDWMQKWKEGFDALHVGDRLIVAPSWRLPDDSTGKIVVQIDPGMAFGTGTHETTRLCLEAIERHWRGGSLLDVGTGTAILAIAAALLVPNSKVVAIDIDPQAIEVARENTSINKVSDRIELREGQPLHVAGHGFDVVVANLTAEVLINLMSDLKACLASGGLMILSGILIELAEDVEASLHAAGFEVNERRDAAEWSMLVAKLT